MLHCFLDPDLRNRKVKNLPHLFGTYFLDSFKDLLSKRCWQYRKENLKILKSSWRHLKVKQCQPFENASYIDNVNVIKTISRVPLTSLHAKICFWRRQRQDTFVFVLFWKKNVRWLNSLRGLGNSYLNWKVTGKEITFWRFLRFT